MIGPIPAFDKAHGNALVFIVAFGGEVAYVVDGTGRLYVIPVEFLTVLDWNRNDVALESFVPPERFGQEGSRR